ncbi:DNA internalization-related competence protein ComEC/Rec2 [Pectinatus sottacetonis]|uniref:DNA internalization-related competence protein ComEC/Rec2 n=1 Tax=Pectinatus sottacetonis TaxID=1002795 RepID=UPI001E510C39|nr:DNA internalization-related competence protein ComEC/Rec2 [Pectinatus sottacetonis]
MSGIISGTYFLFSLKIISIIVIILFILSFYGTIKKNKYTFLIIILLFFTIGLERCLLYQDIPTDNISMLIGRQQEITGIVQDEPQIHKDAVGFYHITYKMSALSSNGKTTSGGYYLYVRQKILPTASIGDKIALTGKICKLSSYKNPGRIDTIATARQQNIFAAVTAHSNMKITKLDILPFAKKMAEIRENIRASMKKIMPNADAAAIFAMLFGGYAGIDPDLLDSFTTTGIVHILSVSGSHITLLAGTIIGFGQIFHLKKWLIFIILSFIIIVYSFLSGMVPPVVRSASMGILSYAALTFGRESHSRYLLTLAGLFMLIFSPGLLFDVSFQLSFAATAGLLYGAPFFRKLLCFMPPFAALPLSITLSAQLFCLPFLSWYFHTISLSSLLANIVAVPIVDGIIILALSAIILNIFFPFLSSIILIICSLLLGFVHETTKFLSILPASSVYLPYLTLPGSLLYYIAFLILLYKPYRVFCINKIKMHSLIFSIFLCILTTIFIYNILKPHELTIHFIDVGQGDAALIITPHQKTVMIDTGGNPRGDYDLGKRVDIPYLYHYGVTSLDYIFLSHIDSDHAKGAGSIIQKLPVKNVFIGHENRIQYAALWHIPPQSDIMNKVIPVTTGQTFIVDDVKFTVLYAGKPQNKDTTNETSVVIKVTYKNFSALFTGDSPAEEEKTLVKQNTADLSCTVLKVAHHGSNTSSNMLFLTKVHPRWSVISVGADNKYGHPDINVLKRLHAVGSKIYRTDKNGAVVFSTDGYRCSIHPYIN